jgi:deazaflavin-dependent oxidoreductase (nitroreductase family)
MPGIRVIDKHFRQLIMMPETARLSPLLVKNGIGNGIRKGDGMDERISQALESDRTIDITTTGRKTRLPRRIEIWFHNLDGRLYITGLPGRRDWYANMLAHPKFTFHLKGSTKADLPAQARPITDEAERREILSKIIGDMGGGRDLEAWVKDSPLVEVEIASG